MAMVILSALVKGFSVSRVQAFFYGMDGFKYLYPNIKHNLKVVFFHIIFFDDLFKDYRNIGILHLVFHSNLCITLPYGRCPPSNVRSVSNIVLVSDTPLQDLLLT